MRRLIVLAIAVAACGSLKAPRANDAGSSDAESNDAGTAALAYQFGGPSTTATLAAGASASCDFTATSAYPATSTFSFTGASTAGTITIAEAFDSALGGPQDVTPELPAAGSAQSTATTNPMLYYSFDNIGSAALDVDGASILFCTDTSSIFGTFLSADISCEFDLFDESSKTWTPGTVVPLTSGATSFTLSLGLHAFPPGQTIGAITCD